MGLGLRYSQPHRAQHPDREGFGDRGALLAVVAEGTVTQEQMARGRDRTAL